MKKPFETVCSYMMAAFILVMAGVFIGRNYQGGNGTFLKIPEETTEYAGITSIDINTATEEELIMIPGIGETLALRIVAYRAENGPYESIDDLRNVPGIGKQTLNEIRVYVTVGG